MATPDLELEKQGPIDIIRYRWLYMGITIALLIPGLVFIVLNVLNPEIQSPVLLGIDFRGGTLLEYGFEKKVTQDDLDAISGTFEAAGYPGAVIQIQEPVKSLGQGAAQQNGASTAKTETIQVETTQPEPAATSKTAEPKSEPQTTTTAPLDTVVADTQTTNVEKALSMDSISTIVSIRSKQLEGGAAEGIQQTLEQKFGQIHLLQKNSIGPSLASELLTNGLLALLLAYLMIAGYLTFRFQFDYAICALLALVHDSIFMIGTFALLGALFHTEVDSLFITAMLTVVGFSVHDTIVVFDRIRENSKRYFSKKLPFSVIANASVNQTLARSINTSLTALLPLTALYLFGGETTKTFVLAIIIGIVVGTFSSICVAGMLLAWWREKGGPNAGALGGNPAMA